ncbi:uncharacterized protein K452DRAFT_302198 [Aplosporella prunicola CBS 121167]|uniref:Rab-GAP TBC domain-containing protein n=1 Tax=Aplosporella prunicola CBS 121167 TaxID=1176127 RepID=A0A6A6B1M5_9PEZI|nr:uncharacterized protein K452DRAFT_302198 [Aplosporella prunicola CBS 121167]KAF2137165.1 hypothetical protein K452DRAFT_302198 [Aplosporella prunicola CBS 121167]
MALDHDDDKAALIRSACSHRDLPALIALATGPQGLLSDDLRREAWPILLGANDADDPVAWEKLQPHADEDQVKLDVNRSFVYYPNDLSEEQLDCRKQELSDVITQVLRRHARLCYFQGYHDIVQVFLLVLGAQLSVPAVTRLSLLRIRDFMLPSLDPSVAHLNLLPAILYSVDPALCRHLKPTQPFFALAATITMYAHDIQEYGDIARIFDFLLAHEAVMSIYLFAAIILARKDELLEISSDEPEMLHFTLSKLPHPLHIEDLIAESVSLRERKPPETLPSRAWSSISQYSVLKTTQDTEALAQQTLQDGEALFAKQTAQVRRAQAYQAVVKGARRGLYRYRKPARGIAFAVLVGFIAWYLGRSGGSGGAGVMSWFGGVYEPLRRVFSAVRDNR